MHNIANKFNKKKTLAKDFNRFQSIHSKPIPISFSLLRENKNNKSITTIEPPPLYSMHSATTSYIPLLFEKDSPKRIPQITYKEIAIPSYSEVDNFEFDTIIPSQITMQFLQSSQNTGNIPIALLKKRVRKIIHCYQEKYADNTNPTGLGDFIRSCFFIIQFCTKYDFPYEISIMHPISQFLCVGINATIYDDTEFFKESNLKNTIYNAQHYLERFALIDTIEQQFINYLYTLDIQIGGSVRSYNYLFPYEQVSLEQCHILQQLFEPSREMKTLVQSHLHQLGLTSHAYCIYHIRSGDAYLLENKTHFLSDYYTTICHEITTLMATQTLPVLFIADNNEIKTLLHRDFGEKKCKYLFYPITHLGEGVSLETNKVKHTMIDFYLMAHSSAIYSFSSYLHGSGFSYWCAKMYDIPYKCKYIKQPLFATH